ncbi:hypothetical protein IWW46_002351 [Coemansia sp. RSA 2440]|nr:hypothetical protein IWW46_002351 [Coemansia sp. RSA 2440]
MDIMSAVNAYIPNNEKSKPPADLHSTSTKPAQAVPTYIAQGMDSVNSFSMAKMLCLVNNLRVSHNLYPLVYHDKLIHLAREHARFQAANHIVTHNDGAGQIGDRLTRLGFQWNILAENVGAGAPDETSIMNAWANSPRHLANILHPDIRYLGIGVSNGFWVQDFAGPMDKRYNVPEGQVEVCPATNRVIIYT